MHASTFFQNDHLAKMHGMGNDYPTSASLPYAIGCSWERLEEIFGHVTAWTQQKRPPPAGTLLCLSSGFWQNKYCMLNTNAQPVDNYVI